ncbi:MAG: hypothetical protein U0P45_05885 [Acidimicrobiales bacterium]
MWSPSSQISSKVRVGPSASGNFDGMRLLWSQISSNFPADG